MIDFTELPPRLDLFDDKNTLEADPERAFFVEARLVRGSVTGDGSALSV
jgi:hypothetical protein